MKKYVITHDSRNNFTVYFFESDLTLNEIVEFHLSIKQPIMEALGIELTGDQDVFQVYEWPKEVPTILRRTL